MSRYLSGVSTVVVILFILIAVAALVLGNKYYKNTGAEESPDQVLSEQRRERAEEDAPHQRQRESAMSPKQLDEFKQTLVKKAMLDVKSAFPDQGDAKLKIDNVQLDVGFGGSRQDVVCGNINVKNKSGLTRFVWNSNEPVEIESEDDKARFQLAWSLFCQ
ncbi:MAG: hypothetical protein PHD37_05325 [Gallionellaceae bacterium]|nr:hypothetical protein [Gallionellaceae bacterium]